MGKTLILLLLMGGLVLSVSGQALNVIDISKTAPPDFPQDGSAIVLGDHNKVPHFFWIGDSGLSAYSVDGQGQFSSLGLSGLPPHLFPLKTSPRSYWANALFFWGSDGATASLWALRDSGNGFVLTQLLAVPCTSLAEPAMWVQPYGRQGWLVFYSLGTQLEVFFWGFDGSSKNLGSLGGVGLPAEVKVFERPDLDSGRADIVMLNHSTTGDQFILAPIIGLELGLPQPLRGRIVGQINGWEMVYNKSEFSRTLVAATGKKIIGIPVDHDQVLSIWSQDFGTTVRFQYWHAAADIGALVAVDNASQRFWWTPVTPSLAFSSFLSGQLPFVGAALPLTADGSGNWGFLAAADSVWKWETITQGQVSSMSMVSAMIGALSDVQWSGATYVVFQNPQTVQAECEIFLPAPNASRSATSDEWSALSAQLAALRGQLDGIGGQSVFLWASNQSLSVALMGVAPKSTWGLAPDAALIYQAGLW